MKSAVTFFRKQLRIKGSSQHNGRGMYEMEFDVSSNVIEERMRARMVEWQAAGMVEKVTDTKDHLTVTLKDELFDAPKWQQEYPDLGLANNGYRTLRFSKTFGSLGVIMAF